MQDVSKILTRKYYGKKDPFRSREFRQPRWMELLAVLLFTGAVACLGFLGWALFF